MKVAAFIDNGSACDYYRVGLPLRTLNKTSKASFSTIEKGDAPDVIAKALEADSKINNDIKSSFFIMILVPSWHLL